ncbi:MAG: hypothetical protein ACK2UP_21630 [Candidatus Promineifilaceae bacterium]|jgi:lysine biosynthesis protein LysW
MATPKVDRIVALCPGCSNEISFYRPPQLGEFVTCPQCGDLVEVVSLSPLTLDWSADIDDDDDWQDEWNDDDDYDDDDYDDDFMDSYDD